MHIMWIVWIACIMMLLYAPSLFCMGVNLVSHMLWEEYRLRVFENRVLREIFGLKRDEVTGEWRILYYEELNDPYCSPNII